MLVHFSRLMGRKNRLVELGMVRKPDKSEASRNPWKREKIYEWDKSESAKKKLLIRRVRSILNKITPATKAGLTNEFLDLKLYESPAREEAISIILEHIVKQPLLCNLFSGLCHDQVTMELKSNEENTSLFRNSLLVQVQELFRKHFESRKPRTTDRRMSEVVRRKKFGTVWFIGHLFVHNLIVYKIILHCLAVLLKSLDTDYVDEETVECALILIKIVGKRLHEESAADAVATAAAADLMQPTRICCPLDSIFKAISNATSRVSHRLRFMIIDLAELCANGWKPRNTVRCVWRKCDQHCAACDNAKNMGTESLQLKMHPAQVHARLQNKPHYSIDMDRLICVIYENEKISDERLEELAEVKKRVKAAIDRLLNGPEFRLDAFGSSENGFGSNRSDFDICFRYAMFDYEITDKSFFSPPTKFMTMQCIENALRMHPRFKHVTSIVTAKIPIVKFTTRVGSDEIEGDISYYNELPLHNTRLLRRYCTWTKDDVLSKLGVFIKRWAKECDICDAPRGSLCSYAYILLLIHFLQRLQPHPLLPVLQQMGVKREIRVDGWDVYFCDDAPKPDWSQCTLSVGELFLKFLEFYIKFDWQETVVQISRTNTLTKNERGWRKLMCIEDPFNRDTNLGAGISHRMFAFIIRSFVTSRDLFSNLNDKGIFLRPFVSGETIGDVFVFRFGEALLSKCKALIGKTPREPFCHKCGRIGHTTMECHIPTVFYNGPPVMRGMRCFPHKASRGATWGHFGDPRRAPLPPMPW